VIEEAHAHGLWAAVSTGRNRDVQDAAAAGADTIQQGALFDAPLDARSVSLLREHGVTYVPALVGIEAFFHWLGRSEAPPDIPIELWERARAELAGRRDAGLLAPFFASVQAAVAGGVAIGAGSFVAGGFGTGLQRELELLVEAGLPPVDAVLAATRNAAQALGVEGEIGTLEAGKRADVIVVGGRPWETISDIRDVRVVIQEGRVVVDGPEGGA
jgi:imidazolonepropionase-like amidohydrolase